MMAERKNRIELLAPAGDYEKLKFAINYGADAVYVGGKNFGLRSNARNFDDEQLDEAIEYAHNHNVKVYVTVNIFAHNNDIEGLKIYLAKLKNADAILVADPGIFLLAKEILPDMPIHISTQANITNYKAVEFWAKLGAERIVLARELNLEDIKKIHSEFPKTELECFVHGAMCMAYSGRCLLSNFLTGRDANHGDCAQACRWKYNLVEENRPDEFFPVIENSDGSFILNSKDLCMVNHIDKLIESGVTSLKIEGRMKSIYYVSGVTKIYRQAIDDYFKSPEIYRENVNFYLDELEKVSHRHYSTGFYFGRGQNQIYESSSYIKTYDFVGVVLDYDKENLIATVQQRNKMDIGDHLEILSSKDNFDFELKQMWDEDDNEILSAPHAQQIVKIKLPTGSSEIKFMDIVRRKK